MVDDPITSFHTTLVVTQSHETSQLKNENISYRSLLLVSEEIFLQLIIAALQKSYSYSASTVEIKLGKR